MTVILIWPGYSISSSMRRAMSRASRIASRSSICSGLTMTRISRPACTANVFFDALERVAYLLEFVQALDVGLQRFAARAGPRGGNLVAADHEYRFDGSRLDVVMVRFGGVDHRLRLLVAPHQVAGDERVRPSLQLEVDGLSEIVEQAGPPRDRDVRADLRGEHGGDVRHLDRVVQDVLPVRCAILHPSEHVDELRRKPGQPGLQHGALAGLADAVVDLRLRLLDDLLDAAGMDSAVDDEIGERDLGDLAAYGVEA